MPNEELLTNFLSFLDDIKTHRDFIHRAKAQASRFSSAVIAKVVLDHEIKSAEAADQLMPLVPKLESYLGELRRAARGAARAGAREAADTSVEEIELRRAIGELTGSEAEVPSRSVR